MLTIVIVLHQKTEALNVLSVSICGIWFRKRTILPESYSYSCTVL